MKDDLLRVESAVSATASGNLTWERRPHDVTTALGLVGRVNPLGFWAVRFLNSPSAHTAREVILVLASILGKKGFDAAVANKVAWSAFEFWNDTRCTKCDGRGILQPHGHRCPACKGTGHRGYDDKPDDVRDAISCLIESVERLDRQMSARLRGGVIEQQQERYRLALPITPGEKGGVGGNPCTPKAPGHD